jgi:signal transduction histidine kinase
VKVRSRIALAFAYILITVIIALTIPLAINLRERTTAELTGSALSSAQTIAAFIDGSQLAPAPAVREQLTNLVNRFAEQSNVRVVVLAEDGTVIADSDGEDLGTNFITPGRPEVAQALDGQTPTAVSLRRFSEEEGGNIVVAAAPIIDNGVVRGAVRISASVEQVSEGERRVTIGILIIGGTGLLAGLLLAFALAGSLAKPLTTLASVARRLGRGDLSSRVGDVEGGREFDEVAHSFDEMADRLERTVQAQREFVANASHQLRTPLTGMKLRLESARAESTSEALAAQIEAADREVDRLAEIVDRLLTMAKQIEEGQPTRAELGRIAARAAERWKDRAETSGSTVEASGPDVVGLGNPADLDQVLDNLIDNAVSYAPGAIRIEAGSTDRRVYVAVADTGPGIPKDEQAKVTERFYRGVGAPAGGSGLGLAIARQLTEKWGGALTVADGERGGTRVTVWLRPAEPQRTDAAPSDS